MQKKAPCAIAGYKWQFLLQLGTWSSTIGLVFYVSPPASTSTRLMKSCYSKWHNNEVIFYKNCHHKHFPPRETTLKHSACALILCREAEPDHPVCGGMALQCNNGHFSSRESAYHCQKVASQLAQGSQLKLLQLKLMCHLIPRPHCCTLTTMILLVLPTLQQ